MTIITILAVSMAIASAIFWCIEVYPFFKSVKKLRPVGAVGERKITALHWGKRKQTPIDSIRMAADSIRYIAEFIGALLLLWKFALDISATIWLAGAFSLGGTITGTLIGLTISNVISIFIIIIGKKKKEEV